MPGIHGHFPHLDRRSARDLGLSICYGTDAMISGGRLLILTNGNDYHHEEAKWTETLERLMPNLDQNEQTLKVVPA
ncbi:hypothetical protein SRHO_G00139430 [Serrasalmus rhombeus]